jgi:hypothetical protein
MSLPTKIAALFAALRQEDVDALPPAERRRFADTLRYWAERSEAKAKRAQSGVLARLKRGERSE